MKHAARYAVIGAISLFALLWGVVGLTSIFSQTTADTRGATEQREDTVADGDYRIAAYERFYDMCAAVQTTEARIANVESELADDPSATRESQLETTLTALRNSRAESINEYNAEARKADTAANFRASDLPAQIDPDEETTCTAE